MTLPNGSIDEKYEILERMRHGGMGAVYKVRHRLLHELRVVKAIRPSSTGGVAEDRFLREARVACRLRHPNLAVLHDFSIGEDGTAYLVSELIDGWTLRDLLRRQGPPPLSLGLEIARQSLEAIGYLHRHRIVHRDVSPDNLMLARDEDGLPRVKLIDFGIAKILEEGGPGATVAGVFLGKPRYASPEQFGPEPVDERSDLYSFGVVLYELLTGRCPIDGHDALSLMAGHTSRPPLDFAESDPQGLLPPDLREILLGALEKRPQDRIPDVGEFLEALAAVQARYSVSEEDLEAVFGLPMPAAKASDEQEAPEVELETAEDEREEETTDGLYLHPLAAGAADLSSVDEITWGSRRGEGAGPLYEPLEETSESLIPPPRAALRESPLLRVALWAAALIALVLLGREFWWPQPEPGSVGAERVAARSIPPAPTPEIAELPREDEAPEPAAAEPVVEEEDDFEVLQNEQLESVEPVRPAPEPEVVVEVVEEPAPAPVPPAAPPVTVEAPARHAVAQRAPEPQPWESANQPRGLLRPGPGVTPPVPLDMPRYGYPSAARGTGLQVGVRLALLVDERGRVIDAVVREGAPEDLGFQEAAIKIAKGTSFQPATRYDKPGKMWTELILEFAE